MRGGLYAAAAHDKTELHQRLRPTDPDVNALRKCSPAKLQSPSSTSLLGDDDERVDQGDDESDDFEDDFDEAAAHAAALQEQAEMRAHFNFREERRKTLGDQFVAAMRRKRRLLMRNENLRFRELYRPPEPLAVVLMVSVITVVSGRAQLADWLASIGLVQYATQLFDEGFDDAQFLLATGGLKDETLDAMHIQRAGHRAKLQSLYQLKEFLADASEEEEDSQVSDDQEESGSEGEDSDDEENSEDGDSDRSDESS
ncbi:hypothetical protein BBJ28_00012411 [Nothophytophthora sp. Chile5]|nr:hypothetical protein BBJ28_00012411 [Nothophytophthora sp. Chile5]